VCDEEVNLQIEAEGAENAKNPDCRFYAKKALQVIFKLTRLQD
jgi:hypothetical protein